MNFGFKTVFYNHIYMHSGETPVEDNLSNKSGQLWLTSITENAQGNFNV